MATAECAWREGDALVRYHVRVNKSLKLEKQLSMEHGTEQGPEVLKYVCH